MKGNHEVFVVHRTSCDSQGDWVVNVHHEIRLANALASAEAWARADAEARGRSADVWLDGRRLVWASDGSHGDVERANAERVSPCAPGRYRWRESDETWRLVTRPRAEGLGPARGPRVAAA